MAEPGTLLTNLTSPAMLAGVGALMSQQAMQQAMEEIKDYLAKIDEKVDDVLRAQKDAVLAEMIGVDLVIEEAMTIREHVDRVDEVTWSKVRATALAIARTQGYALLQLDGLAKKVEDKAKLGELAKTTKEAESTFLEWLAVLVNTNILRHPVTSRAVVESSNHVVTAMADLHDRLGIEHDRQHVGPKRWLDALGEVRDKASRQERERSAAPGPSARKPWAKPGQPPTS